ncbi:M28 family peptidase [bacterium]|nr:M28 family peptidase [bacterium]
MPIDWHEVERWIMGEAWIGSNIEAHLSTLCDEIGPRWASSSGEWQAVNYIRDQFTGAGLVDVVLEEYPLQSWRYDAAAAHIVEDGQEIHLLPFNRCPSFSVTAPLVDVGYGTPHELDDLAARLPGKIAVVALGYEPFTPPSPLSARLAVLAQKGAAAAVVVDRKDGGRVEYHSAGDWSIPEPDSHPLPTVAVSREVGAQLRKRARQGQSLHLRVDAEFFTAPAHNVVAELPGIHWSQEHILVGAHHDTVIGTPGGNDNASGTIVVLETARLLARLQQTLGVSPGRSLRFVTFSAEEQTLQGAYAYVSRHHGPEPAPRLAINLDELSTGPIKGLVLAFPHLRPLVQRTFDAMGDGLKCHVMAQLDYSSDHYPFIRAGIDAAFLWRWRFSGRHADSDFHHEPGDTADKVRPRELKEYIGQLARLLLRLSHVAPTDWPTNPLTVESVSARLQDERGQVVRVN